MCSSIRLVVDSGALYCFHRGQQGPDTDRIFWTRWTGSNWLADREARTSNNLSTETSSGPGVASFGGEIFTTRRGPRNDEDLYTTRYFADKDKNLLAVNQPDYRTGNASNVGPTLVECGGTLYGVYPSSTDDHTLHWTMWKPDNNTWLSDISFPGNRSFFEAAVIAVGNLL